MTDLDSGFEQLRERLSTFSPPNLWHEASGRGPSLPRDQGPSPQKRIIAALVALAVAAIGAVLVARAFHQSTAPEDHVTRVVSGTPSSSPTQHPANSPTPSPPAPTHPPSGSPHASDTPSGVS